MIKILIGLKSALKMNKPHTNLLLHATQPVARTYDFHGGLMNSN
jgi:hypothetical protein